MADSYAASEDDFQFDVVVIGAGFVGICIARDLASLGYKIAILDRNDEIGGVWLTNDYPGLKLHGPGSCYRCLSLAPPWTGEHSASNWYRPDRHEILAYAHSMADHPRITVKTGYSYQGHVRNGQSLRVKCESGDPLNARAIVQSLGCTLTTCGEPQRPLDAPGLAQGHHPHIVHSSELRPSAIQTLQQSKRIYLVGSGKAAIDILSNLDPSLNVFWAHRGHTAFFDREIIHHAYKSDGKDLDSNIRELIVKAMRGGKHWTEYGVESGVFVAADGPLTQRRFKWGGGIADNQELELARRFEQILIQGLDVANGNVRLQLQSGNAIALNSEDCLVLCTGQKNANWRTRAYDEPGVFSVVMTSLTGPLCTLLPLCLTIDYLQGHNTRINIVEAKAAALAKIMPIQASQRTDGRELQFEFMRRMRRVLKEVLPNLRFDFSLRHEWNSEWYGKDLDVAAVLRHLC